jgi:hypothetical protein
MCCCRTGSMLHLMLHENIHYSGGCPHCWYVLAVCCMWICFSDDCPNCQYVIDLSVRWEFIHQATAPTVNIYYLCFVNHVITCALETIYIWSLLLFAVVKKPLWTLRYFGHYPRYWVAYAGYLFAWTCCILRHYLCSSCFSAFKESPDAAIVCQCPSGPHVLLVNLEFVLLLMRLARIYFPELPCIWCFHMCVLSI